MDRNICARVFVDLEEDTKVVQLPAELHPASGARHTSFRTLNVVRCIIGKSAKDMLSMRSIVNSASCSCCLRADRVQFRKDKEQQEPAKRQQEKRRCIDRYKCYGEAKVVVDLTGRTMELFIQHLCRHENLAYRENNVPQAAIDFLETHVNNQLRRVDLYNRLCKEGLIDPTFICKAHVNFWIFELLGRAGPLYVGPSPFVQYDNSRE
ncbi:hypothetical protein R1flu_022769 [Riccia fluitans]|uniref:Uncharacterized protein n=1 Tax=Riccia fluitans TaxID=41844 RepID=A0ABD1XQ55_9MARC